MAIFNSPLYSQASGKLGGMVFFTTRDGVVVRERVNPTQPHTADQQASRARMTGTSRAWGALTDNQRAAWKALGSQMMRTNLKGGTVKHSGFQAHSSVNNLLSVIGQPAMSNPPVAPLAPDPLADLVVSAAHHTTPPAASTIQVTGNSTPAGVKVQVYATPLVSPGRSFFSSTAYRLVTVLDDMNPTGYDFAPEYEAKFGAIAVGRKISFQFVPVSSNGFAGPAARVDVIVGGN